MNRSALVAAAAKSASTGSTSRASGSRVTSVAAAGGDGRGRLRFNVTLEKQTAAVPAAAVWLETPLAGLWSDNNLLMAAEERLELLRGGGREGSPQKQ